MDNPRVSFRLYLISDRRLAAVHGGLLVMAAAALSAAAAIAPPGAVALQLREKDLGARELLELARALRALCTRFGAPLIVNDRLDVAVAAGADGAHLPANSFAVADARALMTRPRLVGVSAHSPDEVAAAAAAGADFAVFGPVFDPLSKPAHAAAGGSEALAAACRRASMPVYALGGITAERIDRLALDRSPLFAGHRPAGVGVIGAVFAAADPATEVRRLLTALKVEAG